MTAGEAETDAESRARTYAGLVQRNRFIAAFRVGVPLLGMLVFLTLVVEIVRANLGVNLGISGIRFERDALVIDTPQYSGVTPNGTRYAISAEAASTALGGPELVQLARAGLEAERPDGYTLSATAEDAEYALAEQRVTVAGDMYVSDSRGMEARLKKTEIDWRTQMLSANGKINAVFADGSVLNADSLTYDAAAEVWEFDSVRLTIPMTGEAAE